MKPKEITLTAVDPESHRNFILDPVTHEEFYDGLEVALLQALLQQNLLKPEQYNMCMKLIQAKG